MQRTRGGELTDWHRFRIRTNLGAANLMLGKGEAAARYFLDAAPLRPDDELAVANKVLAYHLLQDKETREKVAVAIERFPNSTRIRSLWIQSAPPEGPYRELLDATPVHLRKDAEIACALCRRAKDRGSRVTKRGQESAKISIYAPFDEYILQRYFSLWDCAAGTQSRAHQFGRLSGIVQTTFSHRIVSHSPFDWKHLSYAP